MSKRVVNILNRGSIAQNSDSCTRSMAISLHFAAAFILFFTINIPLSNAVNSRPAPHQVISPASDSNSVSMQFVKYKSIQNPDSLFFNVLKITNQSNNAYSGVIHIAIPENWQLISQKNTPVNIKAGGTYYLPVRVAISPDAEGGVAYLITANMETRQSASLTATSSNINIPNSYSYVSIPKVDKWEIHTPENVIYFNNQNDEQRLRLHLINKGNAQEAIKLVMNIGSSLRVIGELDGKYTTFVSIAPHSDTTLFFPVKYVSSNDIIHEGNDDWFTSKITISGVSGNTAHDKNMAYQHNLSIWFRHISNSYTNEYYLATVSPLNIYVNTDNLLSDYHPVLSFGAFGNILMNNNRKLEYNYNNIGLFNKYYTNNFWKGFWEHSRVFAKYTTDTFDIKAGDFSPELNFGTYGRGLGGSYKIDSNNVVSASYLRNIYEPINNFNVSDAFNLKNLLNLKTWAKAGLGYVNDNYNKLNVFEGSIQTKYAFPGNQYVGITVGASTTKHNYNNQTFPLTGTTFVQTDAPGATLNGFMYNAYYTVHKEKLNASLNSLYGSKNYYGAYNNRFQLTGQGHYQITSQYSAMATLSSYTYNPHRYDRGKLTPENLSSYSRLELPFQDRLNDKLSIMAGPYFDYAKMASAYSIYINSLSSMTYGGLFRLYYKYNIHNSISPYTYMGYSKLLNYHVAYINSVPNPYYFNSRTGISIVRRNWGVNVYYYYGPYDIFSQATYLSENQINKSIRIMPYYEKYFFNRKMKFSSYDTYQYNTVSNSERISLLAQIDYYFNHGWQLNVTNDLFLYNEYLGENNKYADRNYYLSVGFRKRFDIQQPRVKYYNLKVIFFTDLNGNKALDQNETGLANILLNIDRDMRHSDSIEKPQGKFSPVTLLSNQFGVVEYHHIPQGRYKLSINPLNNLKDLYNVNGTNQYISVDHDMTLYVPFVKSYKIIGRIILKRAAFSDLGKVPVSNIRITAMDSVGNYYSTLTDEKGKYSLYVPAAGLYTVSINDVFGPNFTTAQKQYYVDFNGLKEFDVDFKFTEKKRTIHFNNTPNPAPAPSSKDTTSSNKAKIGMASPKSGKKDSTNTGAKTNNTPSKSANKMTKDTTKGNAGKQTTPPVKQHASATPKGPKQTEAPLQPTVVPPPVDTTGITSMKDYNALDSLVDKLIRATGGNPSSPADKKINKNQVRYKVQIGYYKSQPDTGRIKELAKVGYIVHMKGRSIIKSKNGYTIYSKKLFNDYNTAENYKDSLVNIGFTGAFVVGDYKGKEITARQALELKKRKQ